MASEIATRIKSKLLRRRHSSSKASFLSSRSVASSLEDSQSQGASPGASASTGASPGASRSKTPSLLGPSPPLHRDHVSSLSTGSRQQPPSSSEGDTEGDAGSSLLIVPRSKGEDSAASPGSTDRKDNGVVVVLNDPASCAPGVSITSPSTDADGGYDGGAEAADKKEEEEEEEDGNTTIAAAGAKATNGDPLTSSKTKPEPKSQGSDSDRHDLDLDLNLDLHHQRQQDQLQQQQQQQRQLQAAQSQPQPPSQPQPHHQPPPSPTSSSTTTSTSQPPPAHPQSRPPHGTSRLQSINESSDNHLPNAAATDADDPHEVYADANPDGSVNLPRIDAALARANRPSSLELTLINNSISNNSNNNNNDPNLPNDASSALYATHNHGSNANTPAGASFNLTPGVQRRQSLISQRHTSFIKSLLHGPSANDADETGSLVPSGEYDTDMVTTRKLWVKRPHASPTLITINDDDLVDDVRDMILRKYANSLGRTFDSPDLTLRICPRDQSQKERFLGPEEHMSRTIDAHFPNGQTVDEALVIDIPRRTPKPSPRPTGLYPTDDGRPSEAGEGYFPPMGGGNLPSPHHQVLVPVQANGSIPHSISVLGTGHIPPIPSPGGTRSRPHRERSDRPRLARQHTTSPNILPNGSQGPAAASDGMQHYIHRPSHSRAHSTSSEAKGRPQSPNHAMPTSPVQQHPQARVSTPPPRVSSPRPSTNRVKRTKKASEYMNLGTQGMLSGGVPPISVLIVEDNPINLKLLEQFVKKLKVRWQTAMNGRDAVKKWRAGGFHLVLMDIQLPVMNGLDATREIRRLERVNSIGVFSSSPNSMQQEEEDSDHEMEEKDRLENRSLFKSPVIIVALTASSLQSDRHQALAAGCNDFLTKPVNFDWLERKVMEWGCMQALIDFDGWRKWKDFSQTKEKEASQKAAAAAAATKSKSKKKSSLSSST